MTLEEIRGKVLQVGKLAFERLIIETRKEENSYIIVSRDGKVVKLYAKDIKK
jgi:hypothetical protein